MKTFKRDSSVKLMVAILLTVFLPAGILGIIFGASKHITILLIAGIIATVLGFYGAPIAWIGVGTIKSNGVILNLIENENIYTVTDLASQTMRKPDEVRNSINQLILKGYLKGYLFKNDILEINTNQKQTGDVREKTKCPNCGGPMEFDGINYVCSYCGNVVKKK